MQYTAKSCRVSVIASPTWSAFGLFVRLMIRINLSVMRIMQPVKGATLNHCAILKFAQEIGAADASVAGVLAGMERHDLIKEQAVIWVRQEIQRAPAQIIQALHYSSLPVARQQMPANLFEIELHLCQDNGSDFQPAVGSIGFADAVEVVQKVLISHVAFSDVGKWRADATCFQDA